MHPRAVLQFKSTVRVPRQPTMSVFVLREVRDGRQGEPVVTRKRKHFSQNPRVKLQALVVLSLFCLSRRVEVIAVLGSSMD